MKIFFNEELHKYTDEFSNAYISVTTLIGEYEEPFDSKSIVKRCVIIGKNPNHPKYIRYKGKSEKQILLEWDTIRDVACDFGNDRHNYLEDAVKWSTGYKYTEGHKFINDRIYTIPDILKNHEYGIVDLNIFIDKGVKEQYPQIFKDLVFLKDNGWRIYSEICTYSSGSLISGLIDILAIKDGKFIIIDWKTNRADIKFESGYFLKDDNGKLTKEFKRDFKMFKYPLHELEQGIGAKYTLQLSMYDYLTEQFGLECIGNVLYHIRHEEYDSSNAPDPTYIGKRKVDKLSIAYWKDNVVAMINHYDKKKRVNNQFKITQ